jgi:hypothetical protein
LEQAAEIARTVAQRTPPAPQRQPAPAYVTKAAYNASLKALAAGIADEVRKIERATHERIEAIESEHRQVQARLLTRIISLESQLAGRVALPTSDMGEHHALN